LKFLKIFAIIIIENKERKYKMNKNDWIRYQKAQPLNGERVWVLPYSPYVPWPYLDLVELCEYQWNQLVCDFEWVVLRTGERLKTSEMDYWCTVSVPERW
jgi:hypothetical protein